MKRLGILLLLLIPLVAGRCADQPAGRVVWWGRDVMDISSRYTNGVLESGGEVLTNVVSIAAQGTEGMAVKSDGTVFAFGSSAPGKAGVLAGFSNVVSIAMDGGFCFAIMRDGRAVNWSERDFNDRRTVAGLSNVVS